MRGLLVSALLAIILSFISLIRGQTSLQINYEYHKYDDMTQILKNINRTNPDLCYLYSIGQSVQGRELWVLLITK